MRTRRLGSSDLEVTVVGLGCNNFGGRIDEAAAHAVIDAALDAGVTFFDTADVYGNRGGSEEIIGRALAGRRDQVVLATKFGHDLGDGETARGARARTSARRSRPRCGACRRTGSTSTSTTAPTASRRSRRRSRRCTSSSRRARFARSAPRTSPPAMVEEAAAIAAERGLTPFVSEQSEYSWLRRGAEDGAAADLRAARRSASSPTSRSRAGCSPASTRRASRRPRAPAWPGASSTRPISTRSSGCGRSRSATASRCSTSRSAGSLRCPASPR